MNACELPFASWASSISSDSLGTCRGSAGATVNPTIPLVACRRANRPNNASGRGRAWSEGDDRLLIRALRPKSGVRRSGTWACVDASTSVPTRIAASGPLRPKRQIFPVVRLAQNWIARGKHGVPNGAHSSPQAPFLLVPFFDVLRALVAAWMQPESVRNGARKLHRRRELEFRGGSDGNGRRRNTDGCPRNSPTARRRRREYGVRGGPPAHGNSKDHGARRVDASQYAEAGRERSHGRPTKGAYEARSVRGRVPFDGALVGDGQADQPAEQGQARLHESGTLLLARRRQTSAQSRHADGLHIGSLRHFGGHPKQESDRPAGAYRSRSLAIDNRWHFRLSARVVLHRR